VLLCNRRASLFIWHKGQPDLCCFGKYIICASTPATSPRPAAINITMQDEETSPSKLTFTLPRSQRDSRNFSGSVFLISSDGRMLSLPIPTSSSRDPLNWSKMKRARAFIAIFFFLHIWAHRSAGSKPAIRPIEPGVLI